MNHYSILGFKVKFLSGKFGDKMWEKIKFI